MKWHVFLIVIILSSSTGAWANTDERIQRLEKQLRNLERTYIQNNQEIASTLSKAQSTQRDMLSLKGDMENNKHLMLKQQQSQARFYKDSDHRITALEERMQLFTQQMQKVLEKAAPEIASETTSYQVALNSIDAGNYIEAVAQFNLFIKKFPGSDFVPLAKFWVAESYFATRDFKRAISEYQKIISDHPKHPKAAGALLKQGESFYQLGLFDEAKVFLEKVTREHAETRESDSASQILKRISLQLDAKTKEPQANNDNYPNQTVQQKITPEKKKKKNKRRENPGKIHLGDF